MFKLIWRIGCLAVVLAIAFVVVSVISGGDKFRWFGEKTGGAIQKQSEKVGEAADSLKDKADKVKAGVTKIKETAEELKEKAGAVTDKVKDLTGSDEEATDNVFDKGKKSRKEPKSDR